MRDELAKIIKQERKAKRELAELRATREKVMRQTSPDMKVVKMIDEEIDKLLKL